MEGYMRRALSLLVAVGCLAFSTAYSTMYFTNGFIKPGTYESNTTDAVTGEIFTGRVTIEPFGSNYRILWLENDRIILTGIGILKGDVFSVSFCNLEGDKKGVSSYELVSNYELRGSWALMDDITSGEERLVYRNSSTR